MKTKMRTKAPPGAAALQVAVVVTSTDWSSNGTLDPPACPRLWGVPQPIWGGGPGRRQRRLATWGLGEAVEAAPSKGKSDGAGAAGLSLEGTLRHGGQT